MATKQGQQWLADQLGITRPRVTQLVTQGRIPAKTSYTDADVAAAKRMILDARAGNNATVGDLEESGDEDAIKALSRNPERVARIKLIIERTAKLKLERELLAGGYVKKEDVERQNVAKILAVRAKLEELPLRSALIAGKTEVEAERILSEWVSEVCNFFAGGAGVDK